MTATLGAIWRHPIKAHGREAIDRVSLRAGEAMPMDRVWGVLHEGGADLAVTELRAGGWAPCTRFLRAAGTPSLMAIEARTDGATGEIELTHPERPPLRFDPDREEARLLEWLAPLAEPGRAAPCRLVRGGQALTDNAAPSLSIAFRSSHDSLATGMGQSDLSMLRWRCNLWIDGTSPWEESGWTGAELAIGSAVLKVIEPITRCRATAANPRTGRIDADTLGALDALGHREFGILAEVIKSGEIATGDQVRLS
ncbi:MOSC domain-containing protein [Profundibacterium mesophilum]|uniref:MOSC N-terminal beta barrel domain containing protein n=1 Tax=Profundibacterium mesophilum KAUST100406-0324 TaxID=1037889 RepID=A0A921NZ47_9RHOB|nr:MOSC N-terminal beta barrel domain-containing protein [Profundibacterium mesophilum]KAF0676178.1 MOSC N-terminal beta barrel domain containing protein [Profundibacterium mesophilum KAUST100406-0324]